MSVTDDDQFAAYGGGNYDYLAMGPSSFGFVTMTAGNTRTSESVARWAATGMACLHMPAPVPTTAILPDQQQTLTRIMPASSVRPCNSPAWPGPPTLYS